MSESPEAFGPGAPGDLSGRIAAGYQYRTRIFRPIGPGMGPPLVPGGRVRPRNSARPARPAG